MPAQNLISAKIGAGVALHDLKRVEEAISTFQDALASEPNNPAACFHLGVSLSSLKREPEALPWLQRAWSLRPSHADAAFELGNVLRALDRKAEAIEAYQQGLLLEPHSIAALESLARCSKRADASRRRQRFSRDLSPWRRTSATAG